MIQIAERFSRPTRVLLGVLALGIFAWLTPHQIAAGPSGQRNSQRRTSKQPAKPAEQKAPKPSLPVDIDSLGPPPPPPQQKAEVELNPGDVISVTTNEVMVPVTVRDTGGRLVPNLTRNDFRVFEDNREQALNDLALRQVPVDVVLMVDASSSVASNLDDFRRAAEGFAGKLSPDDRVSLIKFDDHVELLQDWTQSRFQLRRALNRLTGGMFTRFNDALYLAAREQFRPGSSRRAIIVLTDGIDSGRGTTSMETALRALLEAQVTVYIVSNTQIERASKLAELDDLTNGSAATVRVNQLRIDDLREGLRVLDLSEQSLEQLATATGARLYKPDSFAALEATYAEVADELRHQYAIYYAPLNKAHDGGFRRIRVETVNPGYKTHTRMGYFAPKS